MDIILSIFSVITFLVGIFANGEIILGLKKNHFSKVFIILTFIFFIWIIIYKYLI